MARGQCSTLGWRLYLPYQMKNNLSPANDAEMKRSEWLDRRVFLHFGVDENEIGDGENRVIELEALIQSFPSLFLAYFIFIVALVLPRADRCLLLITRNGSNGPGCPFLSSMSSRMSNPTLHREPTFAIPAGRPLFHQGPVMKQINAHYSYSTSVPKLGLPCISNRSPACSFRRRAKKGGVGA